MFIPINTAPSLATMALLAAITIVEDAIPKSREDAKRKLGAVAKIVATLAKETLKRKVGKPLLEDAELTLACLQERVEGKFSQGSNRFGGNGRYLLARKRNNASLRNLTRKRDNFRTRRRRKLSCGQFRNVSSRGNEGERWRAGTFAYAACSLQGQPLGSNDVAEIAQSFLGKKNKIQRGCQQLPPFFNGMPQ